MAARWKTVAGKMLRELIKKIDSESEINKFFSDISENKNIVFFGADFDQKLFSILESGKKGIIVCSDDAECFRVEKILNFHKRKNAIIREGMTDYIFSENSKSEKAAKFITSVSDYVNGNVDFLIVKPVVLTAKAPDINFKKITIRKGDRLSTSKLIRALEDSGFSRKTKVEGSGDYAYRGDIFELMPFGNEEKAYRIEFFDDEIERLRVLDLESYTSGEDRKEMSFFNLSCFSGKSEEIKNAFLEFEKSLPKN